MNNGSNFCIEIREALFFAYHGLYEEEKRKGNKFIVDLSVFFDPGNIEMVKGIDQTVNYAELFEIVSREMALPRDLMETVAMTICSRIREVFPKVYEVKISITKINPPIPEFSGKVSVTYQKRYLT